MFNHLREAMTKTTPAMTEEEIEIEHEIRHEVIEYEIQHEEQIVHVNSAESIESLPDPGTFFMLSFVILLFMII